MGDQLIANTETLEQNDSYDAVVLGAGISGLVSASVLHDQGYRKILVIDEFEKFGGNHIDRSINGYTFDIGSFIFQDDSPLLKHFPELLKHYVPIDPVWGKLTPQGSIARYPLSIKNDILDAGVWGCARIGLSLLFSRIARRKISNARDFVRYWIGAYLLRRCGLESYMTRFFGVPAEKVDLDFAAKRMMWIKEHAAPRAMLRHLTRHKSVVSTNRQMARPRAGYHALYAVAAEALRARGTVFELGRRVNSIRKVENRFMLAIEDRYAITDRIISTIPINQALTHCGMAEDPGLASVTLISLYFSFSGNRGFDYSVLYNFSHDGAWKRLTVYSDFYGTVEGREYFGVEVIAANANNSLVVAEQDFRKHVARNNLFHGDLVLEGGQLVPNAYPIYVDGAHAKVKTALGHLRAFGLESFGRQGGFDYQPTARVSTQNVESHLHSESTRTA